VTIKRSGAEVTRLGGGLLIWHLHILVFSFSLRWQQRAEDPSHKIENFTAGDRTGLYV
jgi:hypothetical protein